MAEQTELVTSGPAQAFAGLLGVPLPDLQAGASLPLMWHWLYLLESPPQADLGPDGHPAASGIPSPPSAGRRRMFAGGRVECRGALTVGQPATRTSCVRSRLDKPGRSGMLTFVTVDGSWRRGVPAKLGRVRAAGGHGPGYAATGVLPVRRPAP